MTGQEKNEIKKDYSEPLSLDDIRKILHISKRKAAYLLQNGYISCVNTGKKTRQYQISFNALFAYMKKLENGKVEIDAPLGYFNGHPTKIKRRKLTPRKFILKPPNKFRAWLMTEWENVPNALTVKKTATLTGYNKNTIQKWVYKEKLKAIYAQNLLVIPKEWLVDYYCEHAYTIQRKSKKHLDLLKRYYGIEKVSILLLNHKGIKERKRMRNLD